MMGNENDKLPENSKSCYNCSQNEKECDDCMETAVVYGREFSKWV